MTSYQKIIMDRLLNEENSNNFFLQRPLEILKHYNPILFPIKKIKTLKNKDMLSGGLLKEDMTFCETSKTFRIAPNNSNLIYKDWYLDPSNKLLESHEYYYLDEDVLFIGPIPGHYGHFITEGLSRLWPLLDKQYENYKVVYISEKKENPFKEFFTIFGLRDADILRVDSPTQFKSITVPEPSIRLHDYCHELYGQTIEAIMKDIPLTSQKNIFLSKKANQLNGKSIGEENIEKIFNDNDFEIISPEVMSIKDFLSTMLSAKKVAALSATSAHNAIFMKEKSELICLNRSDHHHPLQIMINQIRNLEVTYIDVSFNIFRPNFSNGPFNIIISRHLQAFLKENEFKPPSQLRIFFTFCKSTLIYISYFFFLQKLLNTLSVIKVKISKLKS